MTLIVHMCDVYLTPYRKRDEGVYRVVSEAKGNFWQITGQTVPLPTWTGRWGVVPVEGFT